MTTEKNRSIPEIKVENDVLTIIITADDLKWITEHKPEADYEVVDKSKYLNDFAFNLENYARSNATELGISDLQELIDEVIDETYTNGSDWIRDKKEQQ